MKKVFTALLILLFGIAFVSTGFAFTKPPPDKVASQEIPTPKKEVVAEKVPAPTKQAAKPKVPGFAGIVTMVDANLIDVWGKKAEVTFDASNPEFKGYSSIGDVMVGDTVAIQYTKDGIMITKLKGAVKTKAIEKRVEKAKKVKPEKKAPTKQAAKPKVPGFAGIVTMVDANLIDVWGKKAEVTFDASNPEFKGYSSIGDVMVGDTVAIQYTKDGIMITKLKGAVKTKAVEKKAHTSKKVLRKTVVTQITCTGKGPCTVSVDKPAD